MTDARFVYADGLSWCAGCGRAVTRGWDHRPGCAYRDDDGLTLIETSSLLDAWTRPHRLLWLDERPWVRKGSPLWVLMLLLDGVDWLAVQAARLVGWSPK